MKRIFVISDMHGIPVVPPDGFDMSINLGDFIDAFIDNYAMHAVSIAAARRYSHVVAGNHELIALDRLKRIGKKRYPDVLPRVDAGWLAQLCREPELHLSIEGCRIRASHYMQVDAREVASMPLPKPRESEAIRKQALLGVHVVLYGHNHRREHLVIDGCHAINPGCGERGEYAIVVIDESEVRVEFGKLAL